MNGWYSPAHRLWATLTLAAAVIWLFFSVIPGGMLTTLPGLPFALFAFIAGWFSQSAAHKQTDASGVRRARIGLGISCLGCLWQVAYYLLWGGIAIAALATLGQNLRQGTPTP